jgi:hypothetical protein
MAGGGVRSTPEEPKSLPEIELGAKGRKEDVDLQGPYLIEDREMVRCREICQ